jgi:hypothetical protein
MGFILYNFRLKVKNKNLICVIYLSLIYNSSVHHRVQTGSGAHRASYPTGTRGSFPEGKVAAA